MTATGIAIAAAFPAGYIVGYCLGWLALKLIDRSNSCNNQLVYEDGTR